MLLQKEQLLTIRKTIIDFYLMSLFVVLVLVVKSMVPEVLAKVDSWTKPEPTLSLNTRCMPQEWAYMYSSSYQPKYTRHELGFCIEQMRHARTIVCVSFDMYSNLCEGNEVCVYKEQDTWSWRMLKTRDSIQLACRSAPTVLRNTIKKKRLLKAFNDSDQWIWTGWIPGVRTWSHRRGLFTPFEPTYYNKHQSAIVSCNTNEAGTTNASTDLYMMFVTYYEDVQSLMKTREEITQPGNAIPKWSMDYSDQVVSLPIQVFVSLLLPSTWLIQFNSIRYVEVSVNQSGDVEVPESSKVSNLESTLSQNIPQASSELKQSGWNLDCTK